MAMHMADKNRQAGQDLDRIFMQRKQREQETAQVLNRLFLIFLILLCFKYNIF